MFRYDEVYNRLFENKEFIEILCKFHSSNWTAMDKKGKIDVLDSFVKKYAEILEIPDMKIKSSKKSGYAGSYQDLNGLVNVDEKGIDEISQYDVLDTLFHELRHNFQHRAISKNLTPYESVSDEKRKLWKLNFLVSPRGYSNYISASNDENSYLYAYQPVERDAFMSGLALTKKSYDIISSILGEDLAFIEYAKLNKNSIMLYFSEEKAYAESMKNAQEQVMALFAKNNKEMKTEKACLEIAKETMKKDVKEMTIEELMSLFSVYVWAYLEDDYKLALLKEFDSRVNKYKPAEIKVSGNSAFKVCGSTIIKERICSILNDLFSWEFKIYVDKIISGEEPCDPKLREELTANMYKVNGKKVNYVEDKDNFILYSIQPFALFEGRTIIKWFEKLKEVEKQFYGIESNHYDEWLDFYDNEKYIPYLEKFFEKPFEEIYGELVEKMKKKMISTKRS